LARDLEDVLHFFLPEAEPTPETPSPRTARVFPTTSRSAGPKPIALPILTLPIAGRDVVRAAFAWNLAVELARLGARTTLIAPSDPGVAPLWPAAGAGPMGAEVEFARASDAGALAHAGVDAAIRGADEATDGGVVLVCVPPAWLLRAGAVRPLLRWMLLLSTPEPRDLEETYALAKCAYQRGSDPVVGIVVHGVHRRRDAERAFDQVANAAVRHLGHSPVSYGLLADDLHVYRAIASRRPIGLEHPQSRAARALRDVARMLHEDSQKMTLV
jgi:hypothetical protein